MSLRKSGIGMSAILGLTFLLVGSALADEKDPAYVIVDGKRVPTRVEPPKWERTRVSPAPRKRGDEQSAIGRSGRNDLERPRQPRVLVRDLRDAGAPSGAGERWSRYDSRHGRRRVYAPGRSLYWPYGGYYGYGPYAMRRWVERAYDAGRHDARHDRQHRFNRWDMAQRKQRVLDQHEQALAAGLQRLKAGQATRATVALTLAAKLNQGDPACRIHLAQARLALGHYPEAGLVLRRALQLQPRLVYADLHLERYYQTEGTLGAYTDALAEWVEANRARPEVHFLLGFLEFQRGDFEAAYAAFERVERAMPDDDLTRDYIEITKPCRK